MLCVSAFDRSVASKLTDLRTREKGQAARGALEEARLQVRSGLKEYKVS